MTVKSTPALRFYGSEVCIAFSKQASTLFPEPQDDINEATNHLVEKLRTCRGISGSETSAFPSGQLYTFHPLLRIYSMPGIPLNKRMVSVGRVQCNEEGGCSQIVYKASYLIAKSDLVSVRSW